LWKFDGSKEPIKTKSTKKQEKRRNLSYTVQKGDTLYSISKKLDVSVDDLMHANKLDSTALAIGQELKLK
jgi:LysM repeat protein